MNTFSWVTVDFTCYVIKRYQETNKLDRLGAIPSAVRFAYLRDIQAVSDADLELMTWYDYQTGKPTRSLTEDEQSAYALADGRWYHQFSDLVYPNPEPFIKWWNSQGWAEQ